VAEHGQRGEGGLAASLHGLADAVDRDQLLDHAVVDFLAVAVAVTTARGAFFCHFNAACVVEGCTAWRRLWLLDGSVDRGPGQKPAGVRCSPHRQEAKGGACAPPFQYVSLRTAGRLRARRRPGP